MHSCKSTAGVQLWNSLGEKIEKSKTSHIQRKCPNESYCCKDLFNLLSKIRHC